MKEGGYAEETKQRHYFRGVAERFIALVLKTGVAQVY